MGVLYENQFQRLDSPGRPILPEAASRRPGGPENQARRAADRDVRSWRQGQPALPATMPIINVRREVLPWRLQANRFSRLVGAYPVCRLDREGAEGCGQNVRCFASNQRGDRLKPVPPLAWYCGQLSRDLCVPGVCAIPRSLPATKSATLPTPFSHIR